MGGSIPLTGISNNASTSLSAIKPGIRVTATATYSKDAGAGSAIINNAGGNPGVGWAGSATCSLSTSVVGTGGGELTLNGVGTYVSDGGHCDDKRYEGEAIPFSTSTMVSVSGSKTAQIDSAAGMALTTLKSTPNNTSTSQNATANNTSTSPQNEEETVDSNTSTSNLNSPNINNHFYNPEYITNESSLEDTLDYSIQVLQETGLPETLSSNCEGNWVDIDTSDTDYRKYWCQIQHLIKKEDYSNFLFKYRTYTSLIEDCDTLSEHLDLIKEIKAPGNN